MNIIYSLNLQRVKKYFLKTKRRKIKINKSHQAKVEEKLRLKK